ncbi:MAG: HAD-IB family phosphatase [Bacteroidota bacterium]
MNGEEKDRENDDTIVIFDFDGTLSPYDTFSKFFNHFLKTHPFRLVLFIIILPSIIPFLLIKHTTEFALNFTLWSCTLGLTLKDWQREINDFAVEFSSQCNLLYADGLRQLRFHQEKEHRIFIVTGSSEELIQAICHQFDLSKITVIGSVMYPFYYGIITHRRCLGIEKIHQLKDRYQLSRWTYIYTDSVSDMPLLERSEFKIMVNPKAKDWKKAKRYLGDQLQKLSWA